MLAILITSIGFLSGIDVTSAIFFVTLCLIAIFTCFSLVSWSEALKISDVYKMCCSQMLQLSFPLSAKLSIFWDTLHWSKYKVY